MTVQAGQAGPALLPCPFCGSIPTEIRETDSSKWGAVVCCCIGPEVHTGYRSVEFWRDAAIAEWNDRRPSSPAAPLSDEARMLYEPGDLIEATVNACRAEHEENEQFNSCDPDGWALNYGAIELEAANLHRLHILANPQHPEYASTPNERITVLPERRALAASLRGDGVREAAARIADQHAVDADAVSKDMPEDDHKSYWKGRADAGEIIARHVRALAAGPSPTEDTK